MLSRADRICLVAIFFCFSMLIMGTYQNITSPASQAYLGFWWMLHILCVIFVLLPGPRRG